MRGSHLLASITLAACVQAMAQVPAKNAQAQRPKQATAGAQPSAKTVPPMPQPKAIDYKQTIAKVVEAGQMMNDSGISQIVGCKLKAAVWGGYDYSIIVAARLLRDGVERTFTVKGGEFSSSQNPAGREDALSELGGGHVWIKTSKEAFDRGVPFFISDAELETPTRIQFTLYSNPDAPVRDAFGTAVTTTTKPADPAFIAALRDAVKTRQEKELDLLQKLEAKTPADPTLIAALRDLCSYRPRSLKLKWRQEQELDLLQKLEARTPADPALIAALRDQVKGRHEQELDLIQEVGVESINALRDLYHRFSSSDKVQRLAIEFDHPYQGALEDTPGGTQSVFFSVVRDLEIDLKEVAKSAAAAPPAAAATEPPK